MEFGISLLCCQCCVSNVEHFTDLLAAGDVERVYEKVMQTGFVNTPPPTPEEPRKKADVDKIKRELGEAKANQEALTVGFIPPYFSSDIYACLFAQQQVILKPSLHQLNNTFLSFVVELK